MGYEFQHTLSTFSQKQNTFLKCSDLYMYTGLTVKKSEESPKLVPQYHKIILNFINMFSFSYHPHLLEAWPVQPCQLFGMWYQLHDTQTCESSRGNLLSGHTAQALNEPGPKTVGSHSSLECPPDTLYVQSGVLQAENNTRS